MRIVNSIYGSLCISIVLVLLSLLLYRELIEKERLSNFANPTQEYVDLTNQFFENLAYPLSSMESFYLSSGNVSEQEFLNFTSLILQKYTAIASIYFFDSSALNHHVVKSDIKPTFWQVSDSSFSDEGALVEHGLYSTLSEHLMQSRPITSDIFTINEHPYIGVFLKMADEKGTLLYLIDVKKALKSIFDNRISKDFFVASKLDTGERIFYRNIEDSKLAGDSLSYDLFFFDKTWIVTINRPANVANLVYLLIPIFALLFSIFLHYIFKYAAKLSMLHREKSMVLSNLQLAQEKIIEVEKINAMGGLVAGISHEVNTPLGISITSISHMQDLLNDLKLDFDNGVLDSTKFEDFLSAGIDLADMSMKNMQRASKLVTSFKRVAVVDSDESDDIEQIDVASLIVEFVESYKMQVDGKKINFTLELPETAMIKSYPTVITQILSYITSNTLIHGFKPGATSCDVKITLFENKSDYTLIYQDKGVGVSPEQLKKIFDPFYTTNRGAGNAGLGLNVVYNLVKSKLESDLNYGSKEGENLWYSIVLHDLK